MIELLKSRRSIRKFQQRSVEREKVEAILKAGLLAPSGKHIQPWHFILVSDPTLLEKLADAKEHGAGFVKGAPLAIVVVADPDVTDVWIEDASITALLLQLQAHAMGLGSCWVQLRQRFSKSGIKSGEYVKKLLDMPENMAVEAMIALGYPQEEKSSHREEDLPWNKVSVNRYGKRF